jgi:preprotein translocase subunit SecF
MLYKHNFYKYLIQQNILMKNPFKHVYEKNFKILLIIPILLLVLSFLQIGFQYYQEGDFVNRGVSLKGGVSIDINEISQLSLDQLGKELNDVFPNYNLNIRTMTSLGQEVGFTVDADFQDNENIEQLRVVLAEKTGLTLVNGQNYNPQITDSSLGETFFKQTLIALIIAFILMGVVVIVYFRVLVPALAVILSAFSDIFITLAIFNLTGIKLETAGIAAFLMMIGYSVDTDILLCTRMLKDKGPIMSRVYRAMKTGLTMSLTTIIAILISLIFVQSALVKQIMIILFIGLVIDLMTTWIQNVSIVRLYLGSKEK